METNPYQVALTAAIIPKELYACNFDFTFKIKSYVKENERSRFLEININKVRQVKGFSMLFFIINRILNSYQLPIMINVNKETGRSIDIKKVDPVKRKKLLDKKAAYHDWDWTALATETLSPIGKCFCGKKQNEECKCENVCNITLGSGLMFLLANRNKEYSFDLDLSMEDVQHKIYHPPDFKPNMSNILPIGINIFSPFVTTTIVGREQTHLLEIVPYPKDDEWWKSENERENKYFIYHPNEITYHNVQRIKVKELLFTLENMEKGNALVAKEDLPITLVLHFKPLL